MTDVTSFGDPLGPRGQRRVAVATAGSLVVLAGLLFLTYRRLERGDVFDGEVWSQLTSEVALRGYLRGLSVTLRSAAAAIVVSVTAGVVLGVARLSSVPAVRWVAGAWVELFRALPSLLLIIFAFFALPEITGRALSPFTALVIGLSLYNSAVFAEIVRAGILSLPRGQGEAAAALGLSRTQALRHVLLPQALRRMLPALLAQGVVVLKDTAYGFVIGIDDLLRYAQTAGETLGALIPAYAVALAIYVAVCATLSGLVRLLERRQRRRYGAAAGVGAAGTEDVAVLAASAAASVPAGRRGGAGRP